MSHQKSYRSLSPLSEPEEATETPQHKGIRNRGAYFKAIQARSGRVTDKERQRRAERLREDTSRLKQMLGLRKRRDRSPLTIEEYKGQRYVTRSRRNSYEGFFGTHSKEVSKIPDGFFGTKLRKQTETKFPDGFFGVTDRRTVVCEICGKEETEEHAAEHRFQAAESTCDDLIEVQPAPRAEKTVDFDIHDEADELRQELLNQRKIDKVMHVIREEAKNQEEMIVEFVNKYVRKEAASTPIHVRPDVAQKIQTFLQYVKNKHASDAELMETWNKYS